jgi:hypothetical protein
VIDQVGVRINDVDSQETETLTVVLDQSVGSALPTSSFTIVMENNDAVVTIRPADLSTLKNALHGILNVVRPERVAIEP